MQTRWSVWEAQLQRENVSLWKSSLLEKKIPGLWVEKLWVGIRGGQAWLQKWRVASSTSEPRITYLWLLSVSGSSPLWVNVKQGSFSITTLQLIGPRVRASHPSLMVSVPRVDTFQPFKYSWYDILATGSRLGKDCDRVLHVHSSTRQISLCSVSQTSWPK